VLCEKGGDVKVLQQSVADKATGKAVIAVTVDRLLMKRGHTFNFCQLLL
jgi:hypothetical protein